MQLMRIGQAGQETPVVTDGDRFFDASSAVTEFGGDFGPRFWAEGLPKLQSLVELGQLPPFDAEGKRIGAPIASPQAVICIGLNYTDHAAEAGQPIPTNLVTFLKHPGTIVGPNDPVGILPGSEKTDWEVEFGFVMGKRAHALASAEEGLAAIAGFTLVNDVSERTFQNLTPQWGLGKNMPSSTPVGPKVVTADSIDPNNVGLRTLVNGEVRQDGNTSKMIFDVGTIVYKLSQYMTLEPGDIVSTGTPAGVAMAGTHPFLAPGDVVELEGDGLGSQRQEFFQREG